MVDHQGFGEVLEGEGSEVLTEGSEVLMGEAYNASWRLERGLEVARSSRVSFWARI